MKKHNTETLAQVYRSAMRLMQALREEEVYRISIAEAARLVSAKYGTIFWSRDGELERVYSTVPKSRQFAPRPNGNTHWVYTHRKPRYMTNKTLKKAHPQMSRTGVNTVVLIPLAISRKSLGVISLQSDRVNTLTTTEKQQLKLFGSMACLAIRNALLYKERVEAVKTRDLFMSVASHELRTPLATILAATDATDRRLRAGKQIEVKWIKMVKNASKRLEYLINDFLTVNQVLHGKLQIQPVKIEMLRFARQLTEDFQLICTQSVNFETDITKPVYATIDENKVYIVMTNLLRNARKYSPEDSSITVKMSLAGETIELMIQDEGSGISPGDIGRVFEKFFQGGNHHNGFGLGLYVSREIIRNHRGDIRITSKVNKGTSVIVTLPVS